MRWAALGAGFVGMVKMQPLLHRIFVVSHQSQISSQSKNLTVLY